jgi:hypothetical protein
MHKLQFLKASTVRKFVAEHGYRTSADLLDDIDSRVRNLLLAGIRGTGGLGVKTVKGEHVDRGLARGS